jgi:hypothetical protein
VNAMLQLSSTKHIALCYNILLVPQVTIPLDHSIDGEKVTVMIISEESCHQGAKSKPRIASQATSQSVRVMFFGFFPSLYNMKSELNHIFLTLMMTLMMRMMQEDEQDETVFPLTSQVM